MVKSEATKEPRVLVLGIGNLLWADEGFGIRAIEDFYRRYEFPDNVKIMDGGTQGIYLVQHVRDCDILIVFDAVDYGLEPGTLKRVEGDEVPKFLGVKKISLHQTGFQEVLAMAEMMGEPPEKLLLIGVQPVELDDYGGSLRPKVKAQIDPAIEIALEYLADLNIQLKERIAPLNEEQTPGCTVMLASVYEDGRPSNREAMRAGDARLVMDENWQAPENFEQEMNELLGQDETGAAADRKGQ